MNTEDLKEKLNNLFGLSREVELLRLDLFLREVYDGKKIYAWHTEESSYYDIDEVTDGVEDMAIFDPQHSLAPYYKILRNYDDDPEYDDIAIFLEMGNDLDSIEYNNNFDSMLYHLGIALGINTRPYKTREQLAEETDALLNKIGGYNKTPNLI